MLADGLLLVEVDFVDELEELDEPPHAATTRASAPVAPVPPIIFRNFLRDDGSCVTSASALSDSIRVSVKLTSS